MTIKELKDYIFNDYYKRIGITEENSFYSMKRRGKKDLLSFAIKLIENVQYCQSYLKKKTKLVTLSKTIFQLKTLENPNIVQLL